MPDDINNSLGGTAEELIAENAIITLAQARVYLNKKESDVAHDVFLQSLINIASSAIENEIHCCVTIQEFADEILDGNGKDTIYPPHIPIVSLLNNSLTDVQYRDSPADDWQNIEDEIDYIIIKKSEPYKIKLYQTYFPQGDSNVKISYKAGYETIPGAITRVCLEMVAEMYKESNRGDGRLGINSKSNSGGMASGSDSFKDLSERHKTMLQEYRRWTL